MKKNNKKEEQEEEEIPPFSSEYVADYFEEIERRFNTKPKGRTSKEWINQMNQLIEDCENLRRKVFPKTDKSKVYNKL